MLTVSELLDSLEKPLVFHIRTILEEADIKITDEEAKNLLGKIGTRITFGKEVVDKVLTKK